jgi:N-methylhydantoinase B
MGSKMLGIRLVRGDRLRLCTPGGGGWGPPAARDAGARAADEALGYVAPRDALERDGGPR